MTELASISGDRYKAQGIPTSMFIENMAPADRDQLKTYQLVVKSKETHAVYGLTMQGYDLKHALKRAKIHCDTEDFTVYPAQQYLV